MTERNAVGWFRVDEHDILQRLVAAAAEHEFDSVIRICADNPFLSMSGLRRLIDFSTQSGADYVSFRTSEGTLSIKPHFGFWTEYVTLDALKLIQRLTVDTQNDFTVAAKIYAEAVRQNLPIKPENVIPLVSAEMKSAMRQQMPANSK